VLEFPSGTLQTLESPAAGGARVVRACSGHGAAGWRPLGSLRPNPGYSDELMTVGWMVVDATAANGATETEEASSTARLWSAQTLERALTSLDEAVDGRSVSAWFLARQRGWL
jgi:ADP-ribose pyrophosphatase